MSDALTVALLNLSVTQNALRQSVTRLSTGLRVNSAADDPSGYAIGTSLRTQVSGFNQAAQNVQNANNAIAVATGALGAVQSILQRLRRLAVEASSDVSSASDRADLQAEAAQLLLEIDRVAQNTSFNGQPLLDGSHQGFVPAQATSASVEQNPALNNASPVAALNGAHPPVYGELNNLVLATQLDTNQQQGQQPQITVTVLQNVSGSPSPQTVQITGAQYLRAGMTFMDGVYVQSVDPANGTITAIFSNSIAAGEAISTEFFAETTTPLVPGVQTVSFAGGGFGGNVAGGPITLYPGEIIKFPGTPNAVTVLAVEGPNKALVYSPVTRPAFSFVNDFNQWAISNPPPSTVTINFGIDTQPPPIGSAAYIVAQTPGAVETPIAIGTVVSETATTYNVSIPAIPASLLAGASLNVETHVGIPTADTAPLDGSIELQVVNNNGSAAVQESFYSTATQLMSVSNVMLDPDESSMLFDGTIVTLGNFGLTDVGEVSFIKILQSTAAVNGSSMPAFQIQSGADEGDELQVGIQAVNTNVLRLSNTNLTTFLGAEDAIGQVDYALGQVVGINANLGAISVRLGYDQGADGTAATNLLASSASITDLNVGAEATNFTRLNILAQVGESAIAQSNADTRAVLRLFSA